MTVGRVCQREVDLADPDETVQAAAQRMAARNVGSLVVVDVESRPIGILTDRDLAMGVVATAANPLALKVSALMSHGVEIVRENQSLNAALEYMARCSVRRMPVVDGDRKLVGMITLDDMMHLIGEEFGQIRRVLRESSPRRLAET
ncbi:MAG: CBS domain-containing protein [Planctomycetota bacterium]